MTFDVGDSVPLAWDVKDATGTLTNAGTAVLTLTLPDGTTATPAVSPPGSTGHYQVTYVPTQVGVYTWTAVMTSPNAAYEDVFVVREQTSPSIISIADAKVSLNIPTATTTFDDELREFCEAVTRSIEDFVGPIVRRTYVRRVWGYDWSIRLPHSQILSITSVTLTRDGSIAVDPSLLNFDPMTGIVNYKDMITRFPYGELQFTYVVGRTVIPPNFTLAAKMVLQSNWRSQLGNLPAVQGEDDRIIPTNQSVPFYFSEEALALLSYDNVSGGFA